MSHIPAEPSARQGRKFRDDRERVCLEALVRLHGLRAEDSAAKKTLLEHDVRPLLAMLDALEKLETELTGPQQALLRYIGKWGEASSTYAQEVAGCRGKAFDAVLHALYRRDLIRVEEDGLISLTAAGREQAGSVEEGE